MIFSVCLLPRLGRRALLGVAWMTAFSFASAAESGVAGTLPEDYLPELKGILQTALKQSPRTIQQSINLAQAEANRYLGDSILWPLLGATASYSSNTAATASAGFASASSTSKGIFYGLYANQPVFQWGAYKAQADISRLGVTIAQHQFADAYLQLAVTLREQYLDLVAKKVGLRNLRYQLKLAENELALQEQRLREGSVSPGALTAPRLNVQEGQLGVERTEQNFEYSKRQFVRLAGLDDLREDSISVALAHPTYTPDTSESLLSAFLSGGVKETLQGKIYILNLKQSDLSYRIAKTRLYPKFFLNTAYNLSNSTSATVDSVQQVAVASYSTSISANWTIFDGFATRGAKLSALASKRSSERQLQTYIDTTMDAAQNLRKQVDFSARALNLAETRLALANDGFKRINEDLKLGNASQSDVDSAMINVNSSELGALSARAEYLNRWSQFVSLVGADPIVSLLPARYLNHGK